MSRARYLAFIGGLTAATATLASCSSGPAAQTAGTAAEKVAKVVVVSPQTGSSAAVGLQARNGVMLAVKQANDRHAIPGWRLEVVAMDDKDDKPTAASVAAKAAADGQVAGVIGSVFSGLTKAMLPELAKTNVPTISPAATNPTLSKGAAYATAPKRPFPFFYRVIAPDDAHGPAVARYLTEKGVTSVATVSDGDTYGTGLVDAFRAAYKGRVVDVGTVSGTNHDYAATVAGIKAAKVQAVFFGGSDPEGGPLSLQVKRSGAIIPVAGGDALGNGGYIAQAGPVSAGDLSTKAGEPLAKVAEGRQFLADYAAEGFDEPPSGDAAMGYDAATALITALKQSLPGASSPEASRAATVKALAGVRFAGTSGPIAFDAFGDVTPRVVTVQVLERGAWVPGKTYNF